MNLTLTPYGTTFNEELTFEEWKNQLEQFKTAKNHYINNLSSMIRYGKEKWGEEKVGNTLEQLEFELADATRALAISDLSEEFKHRHKLTAEHNYLLSLIKTEEEREKWAELTIENTLSPIELKKSIQNGTIITQQAVNEKLGRGTGILTIQGIVFQYNQWIRTAGGKEKLLAAPPEEREKFLNEISPILDLAATIDDSLHSSQPNL